MHTRFRRIGGWAPLPAALSFVVYGIALELWPAAAGHFFAALFQLDPYWLRPLHGWGAVVPGVLIWLAACYAATAIGWTLWHGLRARVPLPLPLAGRAQTYSR